ncbi:hypothetical protein E2C01_097067 [Portunus trituberculatus]|uniref:Uncharacterized protein n=1 Tax=Portunus trituberculatus TaxID=210409 RepID=A0A5B7KA63_PORTR|nr:hypothetical protein [Portunus trituberculatus]
MRRRRRRRRRRRVKVASLTLTPGAASPLSTGRQGLELTQHFVENGILPGT